MFAYSSKQPACLFFVARWTAFVAAAFVTASASPTDTLDSQNRTAPIPPIVRNLNVSGFLGPEIGGNFVAFVVSEFQEGSADLNADGDSDDYVVHVHDVSSGVTTNLGMASTAFDIDGPILTFLVNENAQDGEDLNGDGDSFDQVAFVYDGSTGSLTNLGISTGIETFGPQVNGHLIAISVDEYSQGATDLNGDGDIDDRQILHIHNVLTGETVNLELATTFVAPSTGGTVIAFPVIEYEQGQSDLNGDNDFFDAVLHVYDSTTGMTTNVGIASSYSLPSIQNNLLAFDVEEFSQGESDFNGDGDTIDRIAFFYNARTGELRNLGLALTAHGPKMSGNNVVVSVYEDAQGEDLNSDGDLSDRVVHVYDIVTETTTNLGVSSAGLVTSRNRVGVRVWESGQGFSDLNGDGDSDDVVLHLYDAQTGLITNLGIAAEFDFQFDGNLLVFRVSESFNGVQDLNGDGDIGDTVVHALDTRTQMISNLGLSVRANGIQVKRNRIALRVDESSQSAMDLNGDGDSGDKVLHVHNVGQNLTHNLRKAVDGFRISDRVIAFEVPESDQGSVDLNNDGDALDGVIHTVLRY